MREAAAVVVGYGLGSIPFGWLVVKLTRGVDIRRYGSGNIGATNIYRLLGLWAALLVFALDTAKGAAAVLLARRLLPEAEGGSAWVVVAGVMSVVGHSFSVFLRFRGGRGVATALGCLLAISWKAALASLGVFALIVVPTRLVSLAGIGGALTAPVFMLCFRAPGIHTGFVAAAVALLVVRHLPNLKRLLAGKEPRFGQRVSLDGKEEG